MDVTTRQQTDNNLSNACYPHAVTLEVGFYELPVLPLHLDAGQVVQPLLVFEDLHCRRAVDAARLRYLWVLLNVNLHQVQLRSTTGSTSAQAKRQVITP